MTGATNGESAGNVLLFKVEEQYLPVLKNNLVNSSVKVYISNEIENAMQILEKEDLDIILTDYDPGVEASVKFLSLVKQKYPSIYRIVMCNTKEHKKAIYMVFKVIANNSFEKPHGLVHLMPHVSHILDVRRTLKTNNLLNLVSTIENLIALPGTYHEFTRAREKNKSKEEIVGVLEKDVSITAKILHIANSAFHRANKITSIKQAYDYLGDHNMKNIVTIFCFHSKETLNAIQTKNFESLIIHSLRVNKEFHTSFPIRTKESLPDSFASIGLTHDIGKIIILKYITERFNKVIDWMEDNEMDDFYSSEVKLGWEGSTHAEIGAYFMELWNLPQENIHTALYHHNIKNAPEDSKKILRIFKDVNYHMEFCKFTKMFG